jgi:integrase
LYFTKFKQVLYKAIDSGVISDLPFLRRFSIKAQKSTSEYLTEDELKKIYNTHFKRVDVKDAFLFSCYTGLRYADISNLKVSDINGDRLRIVQQKTKRDFNIKLHSNAIEILEKQKQGKNKSEKIFPKLTYNAWRENVRKLCEQAGISKIITGHSARHTFGTRAYKATKDILVVSKLLDHNNVSTTQIYAKLGDDDKDQAIDKLVEIKKED